MRIRHLFVSLFVLLGVLTAGLAIVQPAYAYDPLDAACKSGNNDSSACNEANQNTPLVGPDGIIIRVTRLIAVFSGAVAVIMVIIYGIMLVTSYGDSGKATTARTGIIAAAVGLIVIVLAQAIVVFIVRNL